MKVKKLLACLLAAGALAGCASGYRKFYQPAPWATPEAVATRRAAPPPAHPAVEHAPPRNPQDTADQYARRGYIVIGTSFFNSGGSQDAAAAIQQGRDVGADLVLILDPRHTGTVTTSVPITTPTTQTTYSSGTATAYGSRGVVNAYGSGTSTTYGTQTTYVPMTVDRSDFGAVYFIRQRFSLGTFTRDLNDAERRAMQTNKGAVVRLVADATPAFHEDILAGDVVVTLDGEPVLSSDHFNQRLRQLRGQQVRLGLLRAGQPLEKTLRLNP